jgi:hypothetical protein
VFAASRCANYGIRLLRHRQGNCGHLCVLADIPLRGRREELAWVRIEVLGRVFYQSYRSINFIALINMERQSIPALPAEAAMYFFRNSLNSETSPCRRPPSVTNLLKIQCDGWLDERAHRHLAL